MLKMCSRMRSPMHRYMRLTSTSKESSNLFDKKHGASAFYLSEEQYREVMYLTTIHPQLLILQISIETMEYICVGPGVMNAK
jgi:hypothetical protein